LLLQKTAREALGISLKDHIVIVDEAHNLIDTIEGIHSAAVSLDMLQRARQQLFVYLQKFRNKLQGKNRVYVTQVVRVIDSLCASLEENFQALGTQVNITDLLARKGADQVNIHKLLRYLRQSKLARKVDSYGDHLRQEKRNEGDHTTTPVLMQVENFFEALGNPSSEGCFVRYQSMNEGKRLNWLKYMLLDSTYHFRQIVNDARAVVLAGGTMSPVIKPRPRLAFSNSC
jgi:chromosome transmission fidelity protein 1